MKKFFLLGALLFVFGCATWSTVDVKNKEDTPVGLKNINKSAQDVIVTEADFGDRKYKVLGDIDVTVKKTTIFHSDPTKEQVIEKLKEKAAELGADAVILVRFGTVGVTGMSWGSLNGKGRAIAFLD